MLLPAGLLVVDPDGRIRSANSTAERLLGLTRLELAGRPAGRVLETRSERLEWSQRGASSPKNRSSLILLQEKSGALAAPPRVTAGSAAEMDAASLGRLENELQMVAGLAATALEESTAAGQRNDLERLSRAAARAAICCREAAPAKTPALATIDLNAFVAGLEAHVREFIEPEVGIAVRVPAGQTNPVSADPELLTLALSSLILRGLAQLPPGPQLLRMSTSPGGRLEVCAGLGEHWRRVLGERNLPRAAAWLAAQGAMLEEDAAAAAGTAGARRFRIHLAPVM